MATSITTTVYNRLPGGLVTALLKFTQSERLIQRLVPGQDVLIRAGVGRGLWFNCGRSNPAYALGNNELIVQDVFESFLKTGDILFDIGANVGFFAIISARLVGPQGHVYAFEPLPDNVAALRHNIDLNGFHNVTLFSAAVAERAGTGELLVADYSGGSALSTANAPPPDMIGQMAVDVVSIDELIEAGKIKPPSMVKIDVEGAELDVFKGMIRTLRHYRPKIIYEIDDSRQEEFDKKAAECKIFLEDNHYVVKPLETAYADIEWLVGHYIATYSEEPSAKVRMEQE